MTRLPCQAICLLVVYIELLPPTELWAAHESVSKPSKRYHPPSNRSLLRPFKGDRRVSNRKYRLRRPHLTNNSLLTTMLPFSEDEEENKFLLWLPYVIFTIVLLILIFMSFIRFHFQRGDQNRRRREELEDKPGSKAVDSTAVLGKGSDLRWDKYPTIAKTIPDHLSLFLQFSQTEDNDTPRKSAMKKGDSGQFYDTKVISSDEPSICSANKFKRLYRSRIPGLQEPSVAFAEKTSSRKGIATIAQLVPKSKNIAFTFNDNGSMVDVRCAEEERSNSFRINEKSDINQNNLDYQSGVEHKSASLSSKGSKRRKLDNHLTQSLERHAFKNNSLSRRTNHSSNHPFTTVPSVDHSNQPYFKHQMPPSPHLNEYTTPPLSPFHPPTPMPPFQMCSSTTSVKMVDAATSPGLALRSSKHHSPYHTLQPLPDDFFSAGKG